MTPLWRRVCSGHRARTIKHILPLLNLCYYGKYETIHLPFILDILRDDTCEAMELDMTNTSAMEVDSVNETLLLNQDCYLSAIET